jgi:hypothetical protein
MKSIWTFTLLLISISWGAAQCGAGTTTLSTQTAVNNFISNNPACSQITGSLIIDNQGPGSIDISGLSQFQTIGGELKLQGDITGFSGLSNISSVGGDLNIGGNALITDLNDLSNLTTVGGMLLAIYNNTALTDISGLSNINGTFSQVVFDGNTAPFVITGFDHLNIGSVLISNNTGLQNIDGFNGSTTVNEIQILNNNQLSTINGCNSFSDLTLLSIQQNPMLTSIGGFNSLTTVSEHFRISDNDALSSLAGLNMLTSVGNFFAIENNDNLSSLNGLNNLTTLNSFASIKNNDQLSNLNGLNKLTTTGGSFIITENDNLTSLDGLDMLTTTTLTISNNATLNNIDGLNQINFSTINAPITIQGNPSLSICSSTNFCNYLANNPAPFKLFFSNNAPGCNTQQEVATSCTPPISPNCKNTSVQLGTQGQVVVTPADVNNGSSAGAGISGMTVSPNTFGCNDVGNQNVTLTVTDNNNNQSTCTAIVQVQNTGSLPGGWNAGNIGTSSTANTYNFTACNGSAPAGQFAVGGGGNNATSSTTDNTAFAYQALCGPNSSITVKVESVSSGGYGGLMMRENSMAGAKQVAIFSNLTNSLRHEARFVANSPKQVQNFMKPSPIWLKLERQGNWIFAYYSSTGSNFTYVHAVQVPMQNCVQVGMAAFTFIPGQQATATFSNVSTTGSPSTIPLAVADETPKADKLLRQQNPSFPGSEHTATKLYPNPAQDVLQLEVNPQTAKDIQLYIFSMQGQNMLSQQQKMHPAQQTLIIDIRQLPPGAYLLELLTDEGKETLRFVKH